MKTARLVYIFCLAIFAFYIDECPGSELLQSTGARGQMEAKIINVDQYGVYVPNKVFYWDKAMEKKKVASLTKVAERLRNRQAVITYLASGDVSKDKRPLVVDIAPFEEGISQQIVMEGSTEGAGYRADSVRKDGSGQTAMIGEPGQTAEQQMPSPEREGMVSHESTVQVDSRLDAGPVTLEQITSFIDICIDATKSKNLNLVLSCYADNVDYYSKGRVSRDDIRRDKEFYFKNWDTILSSLDGGIQLVDTGDPDVTTAKFHTVFLVENERKTVTGKAENIWRIERINSELKIVDEKQTVLSTEAR